MIRTFGATGFGPARLNGGVSLLSLGKPASAFPGRVATDADLMIAVDRQQTRLAVPLDSSATSMTVENAAIISAYNLLTIDNEIVKTTGPPAGNVVPISRGFDGTAPALHLASAVVSGFIDAWHHNALVAEVEAIEQALGPGLVNIPTTQFLVSSAFDFAAQAPGGTLSPGLNVITLSPVPAGVNGAGSYNTAHYLYISDGTGTPEAVLVGGGTAVSGAASGTVIVTCANSHTGAWTIRSATSGIQEAINSLPLRGGTVHVPAGSFPIYATVHIGDGIAADGVSPFRPAQSQRNGVVLWGAGAGVGETVGNRQGCTTLQWFGENGGIMSQVNGPIVGVGISDMFYDGQPGSTIAATALYSLHAFLYRYTSMVATRMSGFAFDITARLDQANFAAGSVGVVDGLYTLHMQATGSGMTLGPAAYVTNGLDVVQSTFQHCGFQVGASGIGLRTQFIDSCDFEMVTTSNGAIGLQVINPSGEPNNFPTSITFKQCYFGGATPISTPVGWHPDAASDIYGGLLFMPFGVEGGPVPSAPGCYGFTDANEYFNFKLFSGGVVCANGDNNDLDIGNAARIHVTGPTGDYAITGFTGGREGRVLVLTGNTGGVLTIKHQTGSTAGNRISVPGGVNIGLSAAVHTAMFVFCAADSSWYFIQGK